MYNANWKKKSKIEYFVCPLETIVEYFLFDFCNILTGPIGFFMPVFEKIRQVDFEK